MAFTSALSYSSTHEDLDDYLRAWLPRSWTYKSPAVLRPPHVAARDPDNFGPGALYPVLQNAQGKRDLRAQDALRVYLQRNALLDPELDAARARQQTLSLCDALCEVWSLLFLYVLGRSQAAPRGPSEDLYEAVNESLFDRCEQALRDQRAEKAVSRSRKRKASAVLGPESTWEFIFEPLVDAGVDRAQLEAFLEEPAYATHDGSAQRKVYIERLKLVDAALAPPSSSSWFEWFAPRYQQPTPLQRARLVAEDGENASAPACFFESWSVARIETQIASQRRVAGRFVCLPLYLRMYNLEERCESGLHCNALVLDFETRTLMRWDSNGYRGTGEDNTYCYVAVAESVPPSSQAAL